MKPLLGLAFLASVLVSPSIFAAHCTNATLKGTVMTASRYTTAAGAPAATMWMESWDGAGHVQYLETDSDGISTTAPYFGSGTYTVSAECVAAVTYAGRSTPWIYYLDEDGRGYAWIFNQNTGAVAAGHADLVSHGLLVDAASRKAGPCSNESLQGVISFNVEKSVAGAPAASIGQETYDGKGHLVYTQTDSDGLSTVPYSGTGTYSITSHCVASVYYDGATRSPFIYFVAPSGGGYWWINNQNAGIVAAGKASSVTARP
jgi:hypothetical protein